MMDSTPLDMFAYDPITDETVTVEITVALDLFSRSLLAWRITPLGTKAIDIGLLLADAMTPEPMRPGWSETLRYSMMLIPHERIMKVDERLAAAAARPVTYPETLLVDQGKLYKSDVVRRACTSLGINFPLARKGTPTDKPEVEAVFRTINSQFCEHVAGYKGPDVAHRGRDPQAHARWTIPELEEFFTEYVVAVYQRRWHEGLTVPGYPAERLSPNEAYELGVLQTGYVACPRDPTLYFQLMPIEWRKIHPDGIENNRLTYYGTSMIADRSSRKTGQDEIAAALLDLQNRMDAPESWSARDRRRAIRDAERARAAARDHHRAAASAADTPAEHRVPPLRVVPEPNVAEPEPNDGDDFDLGNIAPAKTWEPRHSKEN